MTPTRDLMQRILLATDGTVTTILEEYAGEAMRAVTLTQSLEPCPAPEAVQLCVSEGSTVLDRKVLLRGTRSGETFLYGDSLIVPERVHDNITEGLSGTDLPIGKLLRANRVETFREILSYGQHPAGELASYFGVGPDAMLVFRAYRILAHQLPLMMITEKLLAD